MNSNSRLTTPSLPAAGKRDLSFPQTKYVIGKWVFYWGKVETSHFPNLLSFQCISPYTVILFPIFSIPCPLCHTNIPFSTLYHTVSVLECFLTTYEAPRNLSFPLLSKTRDVF